MPETQSEAAGEPPLVIDEIDDVLERFRLLRKSDEAATDALLDELGAETKVDRDIVLELSATRPLGMPERFAEAHAVAMRALEVLERNGVRAVPAPARLGPLRPVAAGMIQLVCRFLVRKHQSSLIDSIGKLYDRRLAWCSPTDPDRMLLWKASRDVRRVTETYKDSSIGIPAFLLGGAVISGVGEGLKTGIDSAFGNQVAAYVAIGVVTALFGVVAWVIVHGAAVARRRIRLTVDRPVAALWETIGRAGRPPKDQARVFALYGIALTGLSWLVVPAGVVFILSRF